MSKRIRKYLLTVLSVMLIISACGENKKSMTVGDSVLTAAMLRYYLYNTQASYEVYYMALDTELDWQSKEGEKTLEEKVKSTVLSDIEKKYELVNHISDFNVDPKVSDDEINDGIKEFKAENNKKLASKIDISDKELKELQKNIILYNRINDAIRSDCEDKINESEIRQCSISMMDIKGEGADIAAEDIFDRLRSGEDMENLADMNGITITKGVMGYGDRDGDELENEILNLKEGEYGLARQGDIY